MNNVIINQPWWVSPFTVHNYYMKCTCYWIKICIIWNDDDDDDDDDD